MVRCEVIPHCAQVLESVSNVYSRSLTCFYRICVVLIILALNLAKDPEAKKRMQLAEIKNGRLAMCAIGGAIHHALLTHQGMFEQLKAGNYFDGAYKPF